MSSSGIEAGHYIQVADACTIDLWRDQPCHNHKGVSVVRTAAVTIGNSQAPALQSVNDVDLPFERLSMLSVGTEVTQSLYLSIDCELYSAPVYFCRLLPAHRNYISPAYTLFRAYSFVFPLLASLATLK